jgi:ABC-type uncharacterized transport system permease subunit
VFQATILFLYISAGTAFAASRLPRLSDSASMLMMLGFLLAATGIIWHSFVLVTVVLFQGGFSLTLGNAASIIGLQLALVAVLGAFEPTLRGLAGGLLILGAVAATFTGAFYIGTTGNFGTTVAAQAGLPWQLKAHVLISMFAYGLLSAGAIVAVYALIQDARLRAGRLTPVNNLFAPLETNERLLYGIAASGFAFLVLGILSGLTFVDNFFAQHLVHKSVLSIIAVILFGVLLAGRHLAGWRGRRAVYLYLWGFLTLGLAYFGTRIVLENVLGRSWG